MSTPNDLSFKTDYRSLQNAENFVSVYFGLKDKYSKKTAAKKRKAMRERYKSHILIIF